MKNLISHTKSVDEFRKTIAKAIFRQLENHTDFEMKLGYSIHYEEVKKRWTK